MGLRYRKTFKAGPLRITASKSGVSTSIGGKGARITKIASGKTRTTLSIPGTEFNVNKNWLITGEGGDDAMFNPTPESVFDKFAQDLGLEPRDRILIEKFLALPPEGRQAVMDYALSVAKAVQGDVVTQSPPTYQDGDEEDYADIARRQRLSEKEQAAQVSSAKELGVG